MEKNISKIEIKVELDNNKVPEKIIRELDVLIETLGGKVEYDASGLLAGRIKKQTSLTENVTSSIQENIIYHCTNNKRIITSLV